MLFFFINNIYNRVNKWYNKYKILHKYMYKNEDVDKYPITIYSSCDQTNIAIDEVLKRSFHVSEEILCMPTS